MAEMRYGIIGLFSLLLVGGFIVLGTGEEEHTYVCPATGQLGVFYGGLSSSGERAYPYEENRTGYRDCRYSNGTRTAWVTCDQYATGFNASCAEPVVLPNASFTCSFNLAPDMVVNDFEGFDAWSFNHSDGSITILATNNTNYNVSYD